MKTAKKQSYLAPRIKNVNFKVECGFEVSPLAMSTSPFNEANNSREKFWDGQHSGGTGIDDYNSTEWGWDLSSN